MHFYSTSSNERWPHSDRNAATQSFAKLVDWPIWPKNSCAFWRIDNVAAATGTQLIYTVFHVIVIVINFS